MQLWCSESDAGARIFVRLANFHRLKVVTGEPALLCSIIKGLWAELKRYSLNFSKKYEDQSWSKFHLATA